MMPFTKISVVDSKESFQKFVDLLLSEGPGVVNLFHLGAAVGLEPEGLAAGAVTLLLAASSRPWTDVS